MGDGALASAGRVAADRGASPTACSLLVPVWGHAYVRRFLEFSLPALLAPGNIPALTRLFPTDFVLLTRAADVPLIETDPAWRQLLACCRADIRPIDDIVVDGNQHAAITLAYERALRASKTVLRETLFLFLVADTLIADGSLRALAERVLSRARRADGNTADARRCGGSVIARPTADLWWRMGSAAQDARRPGHGAASPGLRREHRQRRAAA
jgi:hypothetical protein